MLLRVLLGVFLCFYLQIVNISCDERGSLGFAIDDTYSMHDDIMYVKQGAEAIMNLVMSKKADVKEVVLVTFNDPEVELRTRNGTKYTFLQDLRSIKTHGGGDVPEMSLGGMEEALKSTRPGSFIFVFTDAPAKDFDKFNKIKSLCQKKQSQVVIVYTYGDYGYYFPEKEPYTVYNDIAKACSGQLIAVKKEEIDSVLKTIETLLQGKTSIFKWITVPRTSKFVSVKFTLDEKAEYAIVSASGTKVDLQITRDNYFTSSRVFFEKIMWNTNSKFVKLVNPEPGSYYAWVNGQSTISVVVYGRTDFTFQHGFSTLQPKLMTETATQPIAGLKQHVSINVTDPDHSVNIQTVQILDISNNDHIINELPLRNIGDNLYITEAFLSPNQTFKIGVKGEIKKTLEKITRYSKNIDPRIVDLIPESIPEVKISEGILLNVNYGSGVSFTCKVNAHPAPKIEWYTSSGRLLPSQSSEIDDPSFVSYLKLENIKQSETYICKASNKIGPGKDGRIQVGINPIFTNVGGATYNAKYGEDNKISCIKSYLPIRVKWFRSGKQLTANSREHSISTDGSELTLNSMNIEMQGKYTCEATLNSDPTIKKARDIDVKIIGLVHPKVIFSMAIQKENKLRAICRFDGFPKPIISWQFKPKGSEVFRALSGSGEEFSIPEARLKDTGVYKCKAKNVLGETEKDLNVNIEERPIIYNKESTLYGLEGDLVMKITCNVTGFPEPTITWKIGNKALKTDSKYKVRGTSLYINKPVPSDSTEYTCEAKNKLGTATKTFATEIVDNFEFDTNFHGTTHDVHAEQEKSKTFKCNLKNLGENSVRWYKDGMLTKETGSTYTIERVSISEEANFTCRANTNEGSESETFVLYIGFLPIFGDNSPSPITVDWKNDDQVLDCAADSQPPAEYIWKHNGKVLKVENGEQQIPIADWGEYTCQVGNVHGSISKTFKVTTSGCYVTKNKASTNQPLLSDKDKVSWPTSMGNSDILLKENEEIKLSCPSDKRLRISNFFKRMPNNEGIIAKCISEDKFTVDGKTYRYSELQCNSEINPLVLNAQENCSGPSSRLVRVGFHVNDFLEAYKVCYDSRLNVPLYASASTPLPRTSDGVDAMKFVWMPTPGLGSRKTGNWKPEGSCECCYTQSQLVNFKELPFGPAQAATFKDNLNSIPVWNPSCDGSSRTSWQTFNNEIREISRDFSYDKWSSWTGASEYVSKDGGLVPRYLWKVVINDDGSHVTVYVNDKSPVDSDVRCSSPCEPMVDADKFLYCCTLNEFSKSFGVPLNTFTAV